MKMTCASFLCLGLISIGHCNSNSIHGSGVAKTEIRPVGSFSKIDLVGSAEVEVSVGPATSVAVTADDNILPIIETAVAGDTLKIGSQKSVDTRLGVKVKITVPALDGVAISGSGNIHAQGLKSGTVEAGVIGSGNITLNGMADLFTAQIAGSGDLRAGDLSAKRVHVIVAGSGSATVQASQELDASVTGSGNVNYTGNPPQVRRSVTGSGNIRAR
jgi:hypothetical protein